MSRTKQGLFILMTLIILINSEEIGKITQTARKRSQISCEVRDKGRR